MGCREIKVIVEVREFRKGLYITWVSKVSYYADGNKVKTSIITKEEITQDIISASLHGVIESLDLINKSGYIGIEGIEIKAESLIGLRVVKYKKLLSIIHSYSDMYNIHIIGKVEGLVYDKVHCR